MSELYCESTDALDYADPFEDEQCFDSDELAARCGFGCTTGVDSVMNHEGMLAIGLAMQEEHDVAY
jgi:hypothetical protein